MMLGLLLARAGVAALVLVLRRGDAQSPPLALRLLTRIRPLRRLPARLIGIGVSNLEDATGDDFADLIDRRAAEAEHAVDRLREKFGKDAVVKGLALDED